jgi:hypothetical protein
MADAVVDLRAGRRRRTEHDIDSCEPARTRELAARRLVDARAS